MSGEMALAARLARADFLSEQNTDTGPTTLFRRHLPVELVSNGDIDRDQRVADFQRLKNRLTDTIAAYQVHVDYLAMEVEAFARMPGDGSPILGYIADLGHGIYCIEELLAPTNSAITSTAHDFKPPDDLAPVKSIRGI